MAGFQCPGGIAVQKQFYQGVIAKEIQQRYRNAQKPHQLQPRPMSLLYPLQFSGAHILGGVIGNAVSNGGKRRDDQIVQLHRCTIACHNGAAVGIDDTLNHHVAHRNKHLLQHTGDCHRGNLPQNRPGKEAVLRLTRNRADTTEYQTNSQYTADPLADQRCPCYPWHTQPKHRNEQDIHPDIGKGGTGQKVKGCFGIAQCRENARRHIVVNDKGQAQYVNIQIVFAIRQHIFRRMNRRQQPVQRRPAQDQQPCAQNPTANESSIDGGFQISILLGSEFLRGNHAAANVAAERNSDEQQGDLVSVAHSSQSRFAQETACHQAVGHVVHLLEDHAAKHRQAEPPQHTAGFSHRQISYHSISSRPDWKVGSGSSLNRLARCRVSIRAFTAASSQMPSRI